MKRVKVALRELQAASCKLQAASCKSMAYALSFRFGFSLKLKTCSFQLLLHYTV